MIFETTELIELLVIFSCCNRTNQLWQHKNEVFVMCRCRFVSGSQLLMRTALKNFSTSTELMFIYRLTSIPMNACSPSTTLQFVQFYYVEKITLLYLDVLYIMDNGFVIMCWCITQVLCEVILLRIQKRAQFNRSRSDECHDLFGFHTVTVVKLHFTHCSLLSLLYAW